MGLLADYAAKLRALADEMERTVTPGPPPSDPFIAVFRSRYGWTSQLNDADLLRNIKGISRDDWLRYAPDERAWMVSVIGGEPGQKPPTPIPAPPPVPAPLPVPPPAPVAVWQPAERYPSAEALREVLAAHRDFSYAVTLDSKDAFEDGVVRFGPADQFHSWPDGTVRKERPKEPAVAPGVRPVGSPLLNEYANPAELVKDAQGVAWGYAVLLDGEPLLGGYEASPPANYVRRNGKVVRA